MRKWKGENRMSKWQQSTITLLIGWISMAITWFLIEDQSPGLPMWIVMLACLGAARVARMFVGSIYEVFGKDIR